MAIFAAGLDRRLAQDLGGPRRSGSPADRAACRSRRRSRREAAARDGVDSGRDAPVPFIFQLPATSGRIPGVMPLSRLPTCPVLLPKSGHKAIDTGLQGGYCLLGEGRRPAARQQVGVEMLSLLRSAAGTWVAKGLLSLLVVSFAVWGISGQLHQGFGAGQYVDHRRRHHGFAERISGSPTTGSCR